MLKYCCKELVMNNIPRIAFIQSGWHENIVDQARRGFAERLQALGVNAEVDYFRVPGAFEIPLKCKQLLKQGDYSLAVAAGFVVDGGIYRHEFVAQAVISALMQVQLDVDIPVLSVVLTPKESWQEQHHAYFFEHMLTKGREAADVAADLLKTPVRAARTTAAPAA
jgi:6,7-dimethyl-8-ribityllumazine synthase